MKRRDMIKKALATGAFFTLGKNFNSISVETEKINSLNATGNALRFPPVFTNGGTMTLANSNVNVWTGQNTQVTAINGSYPGPSVVIQKGSTFTANFINQLSEPATTHWHGISTPELMDGHPKDPVAPGSSYTYTFPVLNRAGTYFYHAHADMLTAEQVYKGFAGFFIVTDPDEISLGLPRGAYDVPICLQDRRIADIPDFTYNTNNDDVMHGYLGDTVLVNGTPDAYYEVSKTLYRFRLLNGSNARVYKIALSDNNPFHIIATDGGLKDAPVQVTSFYLSPGERVDILVDFSSYNIGQSVSIKSQPFTAAGTGTYRQGVELNILRLDITGNNSSGGIIPSTLTPITYYNPSDAMTVRTFNLSMSGGGPGMHKINGLSFELNRIDWESPINSLEEWKIFNGTSVMHPMHSHESQFQVYSRNGNINLPPSDKGWKDTVLVNPLETVRVLVKFTEYKGIYLFHCHNLEHEDDGMMLNFKIVDKIGINEVGTSIPEKFYLYQNYPNPFNPVTNIKFDLPEAGKISLKVYDRSGKKAAELLNGHQSAGTYEIIFDASGLSSGVYFYKIIAGKYSATKRMLLIK